MGAYRTRVPATVIPRVKEIRKERLQRDTQKFKNDRRNRQTTEKKSTRKKTVEAKYVQDRSGMKRREGGNRGESQETEWASARRG